MTAATEALRGSVEERSQRIEEQLQALHPGSRSTWTIATFPDKVVYRVHFEGAPSQTFQRTVSETDGAFAFGDPVEVKMVEDVEPVRAQEAATAFFTEVTELVTITEAATLKSRVQSLLRSADAMIADRAVPSAVRQQITAMRSMLKKKYADLPDEGDAATKESADIEGDFVPLVEKALRRDGTVALRLIEPGWGSSGFYSPDVLGTDGPKVFTKGTKMFWDHPTVAEEAERPERSLRDLAAELVSDARYEAEGPVGPGLYADAKVFGNFKEHVTELAPHIGVSIRGEGIVKQGEADGRKGPLVEKLVRAKSVDFVTSPGAGGKVLELFEAARSAPRKEGNVDLQEAQNTITAQRNEIATLTEGKATAERERDEANKELARLREGEIIRTAKTKVAESLKDVEGLPDVTRTRLVETIGANPPVKADGTLDEAKLTETVNASLKAEAEYLSEAVGADAIRGAGGVVVLDGTKPEKITESLDESFRRLGMSEATAKIAAEGR